MHGWLDWLHASVSKGLRLVAIQRERNRHHKLSPGCAFAAVALESRPFCTMASA